MIYLDHHAASPPTDRVRARMTEAEAAAWGNPSSIHAVGRAAKRVLEQARDQVAASLGAAPADLVFTSGGTEAVNLGILGLAGDVRRVMVARTEHPAVLRAAETLCARGAELDWVDPRALPEAVRERADRETLVLAQWVNHETGTLWPVEDLALRVRERGARLFVDACQALGKLPIDVASLGADAVAVAAHKAGGPAGAGALWVARGVAIEPRNLGGAQERGRRAGTPDVVRMVGFGAAAEEIPARLALMPQVAALRDRLEAGLVALGAVVNGAEPGRVATATNVSFARWRGELLTAAMDLEGVAISAGPACSSGVSAPSATVAALHPGDDGRAAGAVRASLAPDTTDADVTEALACFARVLGRKT